MQTIRKLLIAAAVISLTACGTTASQYRPIVDGAQDVHYEQDLANCSTLSETKSYINDDVKSEAALGAVIGAVVGAIDEGSEGAIGGAIVGALFSGADRSWQTREERKQIVVSCMQQRGHQVVG